MLALQRLCISHYYYLRRCLASGEGIVLLGVRLCVCPPIRNCTYPRACFHGFDAIRRKQKNNLSIFRRSRVVVESQYRLNA